MKNKLGRLYFRYILHSKLEAYGYNAKKLASELQAIGLIKVDKDNETYDELDRMPTKKALIEMIIDRNAFNDIKRGMVVKFEHSKGEILGTDKLIYVFDEEQVQGPIDIGDKVKFKSAFINNSLAVARDITKD